MSPGGQTQKAGQGANQYQTSSGDIVIHQGVSEERVRAIMHDEAERLKQEFAIEARAVIEERLEQLDDRVVPRLATQGALGAFGDPAFIRSYRKAQNGAAATEREADYDMLAALLADRAEGLRDRPRMVAIDRAMEIVDQIDEGALRALTAVEGVRLWTPNIASLEEGLDELEHLMSDLIPGDLPSGSDWIEQLDILDALRIGTFTLRPFDEYFPMKMNGYVAPGAQRSSAALFENDGHDFTAWGVPVMDHELKPGYVRIAASCDRYARLNMELEGRAPESVEAAVAEAQGDFGLGSLDQAIVPEFLHRVKSRPTLAVISSWWDAIPTGLQITVVGRTLARANMHRLDLLGRLPQPERRDS
ncbi:LPO_1073/Vpar_1526 family protein [Microbacterium trichothecenolyticum]|uniref:LPO_1073/Vpar_1526 family protein n=1 Tax=Microbacterium trichothecenolyticum TaxID=69370 RepID=UPI0035BE63EB